MRTTLLPLAPLQNPLLTQWQAATTRGRTHDDSSSPADHQEEEVAQLEDPQAAEEDQPAGRRSTPTCLHPTRLEDGEEREN